MARLVSLPVRLLVPAALTAAMVAGPAAPAGAVAHGEPVPDGGYRFAARLVMTGVPALGGLGTMCSGALVAPSWVVTAGHCFVDPHGRPVSGPVPYPTTALVGQAHLLSGPERGHLAAVTEVQQAPGTDLALARLAAPAEGLDPIALSTSPPEVGARLRLVGAGATNALLPLPVLRLQTGQVTVTAVTATDVRVTGLTPARDTSACLFDSGAPYFVERRGGPRLVSIESDGPACPHDQEETTARVDTVAGWIRGILRRHR